MQLSPTNVHRIHAKTEEHVQTSIMGIPAHVWMDIKGPTVKRVITIEILITHYINIIKSSICSSSRRHTFPLKVHVLSNGSE